MTAIEAEKPARAPKQSTPRERPLLGPRLFALLGVLRRCGARSVRQELGLSDFEWLVMSHVGSRALSFNELACILSHDKGQLSRGVKRLVEAGLLTRQRRRSQRGVIIAPTEAGQEVFRRLIKLAIDGDAVLVQGVSDAELDAFLKVMERLMANSVAALSRLEPTPPAP